MSRRKVKARDKVTIKNTRDGIVERNESTGADVQISTREETFDLRGQRDDMPDALHNAGHQQSSPEQSARRRQIYRHSESDSIHDSQSGHPLEPEKQSSPYQAETHLEQTGYPQPSDSPAPTNARAMPPPVTTSQRNKPYSKHQAVQTEPAAAPETPTIEGQHNKPVDVRKPTEPTADNTAVQMETVIPPPKPAKTGSKLNTDSNSRLQFTQDEAAPTPQSRLKQKKPRVINEDTPTQESTPVDKANRTKPDGSSESTDTTSQDAPTEKKPSERSTDSAAQTETAVRPKPAQKKPETPTQDTSALKSDRQGKLQFTPDESSPDTPKITNNRKLNKAQTQAERATGKLERARDNLPAKKKLRKVNVTDEKTGAVRQKLQFEKTPISQGEHIRGALPLRPVKSAANFAMVSAHSKLFQVEHENVGVKAAHRAEMIGEAGVRSALRFRKTAPYRKVAKLERAAQKKSINLTHQRTLAQNPKLKSNMLTRALQKRKIKKDYAKAAREAQKAAKRAKKAGETTAKATKAIVGVIKRHPIVTIIVILVLLLLYLIMSMVGMFGSLGSGGLGGIAAGTYLAEDADILGAQAAYAGMEADLQYNLDNYAALNPGYDEYVFELDSIWHDPYVLIAILSAMHDGAWTLDEVQSTLAFLFERQYILTETTTMEVRTRPEDVLDPVTGLPTGDTVDVPYNHYIRTVTLENFNLSHLPIYIMGETGLSRYALMMMTLGNRPDLFPVTSFPNASYYRDYGRHDIPQAYLDADPVFAAMITEANKWLGMPYVWGGYSPVTSFDCSGYVSWVLNNSGWNIGRLGAQGLYNISTPVTAANARPGDLVFFHSTYNAPDPNGVTHVGIYVGDGMMVHAGNPIGYVSINTTYWQEHLYAFGRMY
jgi:hypothetical protein